MTTKVRGEKVSKVYQVDINEAQQSWVILEISIHTSDVALIKDAE